MVGGTLTIPMPPPDFVGGDNYAKHVEYINYSVKQTSEWVSEWLSFTAFLEQRTARSI